jgi:hypothetical protein
MRSRPADTDPDAYELQFALLRRVPLARRLYDVWEAGVA